MTPFGVPRCALWGHFDSVSTLRQNVPYIGNVESNWFGVVMNTKKLFKDLNIPIEKPGFYNNEAFLEQERNNPIFIENYAYFINENKYDNYYINNAKKIIPIIIDFVYKELKKDNRIGSCIDVSQFISKVLEYEGFWNYMEFGSVSIAFPDNSNIPNKYFWTFDEGNFKAAHSWVVAPPYNIIDVSIKQQNYLNSEKEYLPDYVLTEDKNCTNFTLNEVCNINLISKYYDPKIFFQNYLKANPHKNKFFKDFPKKELLNIEPPNLLK